MVIVGFVLKMPAAEITMIGRWHIRFKMVSVLIVYFIMTCDVLLNQTYFMAPWIAQEKNLILNSSIFFTYGFQHFSFVIKGWFA